MAYGLINSAGVQNVRTDQPHRRTRALDARTNVVVVDVSAVPSQQEIHPVSRRQSHMRGVIRRHDRDNFVPQQALRQFAGLRQVIQQRDARQPRQTLPRVVGIATPHFLQHGGGDEEQKVFPLGFPPLQRGLLIGRKPQVPAAPRHQIAGDGGFEIEPGFHARAWRLWPKAFYAVSRAWQAIFVK